jgi:ribonuclease Z
MNKLTILGSGTMMPTKWRFPSSFLLEANGKKILLDCGHETMARLTEIGVDPRDIDIIFISHFHTDHFGDCFNLVHARFVGDWYENNKKHKNLVIVGPATIQEKFKLWRKIYWPEPDERYPIEFYEGNTSYQLGDIHLETYPIVHVPWFESIGIRMTIGNKTVVYPGDVGSKHDFDDLTAKCKDADCLLIEPGNEKSTPNHFTLEQIKELAEKASVKNVVLIHFKPLKTEDERIRNYIIKDKSNWIMGEDKMEIEL